MSNQPTNKEERSMARARYIKVSDVKACPITSLSPMHYREDGECVCGEECQWFALCPNPAFVLVPHPVLGEVPTCGRCAALAQEEKR